MLEIRRESTLGVIQKSDIGAVRNLPEKGGGVNFQNVTVCPEMKTIHPAEGKFWQFPSSHAWGSTPKYPRRAPVADPLADMGLFFAFGT